jgi:photosystem II stability/assembly factor-like uncharacterized protein
MKNSKLTITLIFCFCTAQYFSFGQWITQTSGTSSFLQQVYFLNKDTGYVVQDNGGLRRTTNGGVNWNLIYSGAPFLIEVAFTSFDTGHAAGVHEILRSTDGGQSWTSQYSNPDLNFWEIYLPTNKLG